MSTDISAIKLNIFQAPEAHATTPVESQEAFAQQQRVEQIQKETGRKDITLIDHSKGGLVSSYYETHLVDPEKTQVADVITIGSPLAGTPLAYFVPG